MSQQKKIIPGFYRDNLEINYNNQLSEYIDYMGRFVWIYNEERCHELLQLKTRTFESQYNIFILNIGEYPHGCTLSFEYQFYGDMGIDMFEIVLNDIVLMRTNTNDVWESHTIEIPSGFDPLLKFIVFKESKRMLNLSLLIDNIKIIYHQR